MWLLTNPIAMPAAVSISLESVVTPGSPWNESLAVDVGNDGSFEFMPGTVVAPSLLVNLGPAPLPIRVQQQMAMSGNGTATSELVIDVRPVPVMPITPVVAGCDPRQWQELAPTLLGDLEVRRRSFLLHAQPAVAVLGLSPLPIVLPSPQVQACVLVPAPDLLLFHVTDDLIVPLPPAVRPIAFWTQAVVLDPVALQTTNASFVQAP